MATVTDEAIAPALELGPRVPDATRVGTSSGTAGRRRGRPMDMAPEDVLERIRGLARHRGGLFRVHRERPALYARARRLFGSWEGAVLAAGLDYNGAVALARQRALDARRRTSRRERKTR